MKKTLQFRREQPFVMVDYAVVMSGQLSVYELAVYLVLLRLCGQPGGNLFSLLSDHCWESRLFPAQGY